MYLAALLFQDLENLQPISVVRSFRNGIRLSWGRGGITNQAESSKHLQLSEMF